MAKKVTVVLRGEAPQEYENISKVEEERDGNDQVVSIRLYAGNELRTVVRYNLIDHFEAVDQP